MGSNPPPTPNLKQAVPFFAVADIARSVTYYVDGLGFTQTLEWAPEGQVRWCWLERDGVALMLQETSPDGHGVPVPSGKPGAGVTICVICEDALAFYREVTARGLQAARPFVGNHMWVTSLTDPDGYRLDFESLTDAPEESVYEDPAE